MGKFLKKQEEWKDTNQSGVQTSVMWMLTLFYNFTLSDLGLPTRDSSIIFKIVSH